MNVYGYCRCGERVERDEYPEHVLACPAHEEDNDATDTLDASSGTGRAGPVEPVEVDQVRPDIVTGAATNTAGWGNPDRAKKWHFFREGESSSACGRWIWGWPRSDLPFAGRCKRCEQAAGERRP